MRIRSEGRFFRKGREKFFVKGVAYAPLASDAKGQPFGGRDTAARDLDLAASLGANVVRVYEPAPVWLADLARERGLWLWVDLVWPQHLCFLEGRQLRTEVRNTVRTAVEVLAGHPAIFAYSVGNEIPPDIVRWSGPSEVQRFLEALIREVKALDPEVLCTYANFPPTEYLRPRNVDFVAFNVYLHDRRAFRNYLDRLLMLSADRPLVLGECGVDSLREGQERQAALLEWQIEEAFGAGLAGFTVFSLTDDWHRGGQAVRDWAMGLTTRRRDPKPAWQVVQRQYRLAPFFPPARWPKVSVVVASYNGARTLANCLGSLQALRYPNHEVILVDDGSTDATPEIGAQFPGVRLIRHERNLGLSAARNTGIAAATGEIVAFTDDDCRVDEDWLFYLVRALLESEAVGVGGPNLLPPDDSPLGAAVMASPGGPAAVLLTDRLAEHLPGCNMAFYKWALETVGGFDPAFRRAGDDVDVCWRLLQAGYRLTYAPSACVWHYRRSTVRAYLRQQAGYGEAEALLQRKHPEQFNAWGGGRWRGRIYGAGAWDWGVSRSIIYHGRFGTGWFQTLYSGGPPDRWLLVTTPEFHLLVTLPLAVLSLGVPWFRGLVLGVVMFWLGVCVLAAARAPVPRGQIRWWSRPLIALLFALQPWARGWARYRDRIRWRRPSPAGVASLEAESLQRRRVRLDRLDLWSERPVDRVALLETIVRELEQQGWAVRVDRGWSRYDFEVLYGTWTVLRVVTALEVYPEGRRRLCLRIRPAATLTALVGFGLLGVGTMSVGVGLGISTWWVWSVPVLVGLVGWWFWQRDGRRAQSQLAVALDTFARAHGLIRLPWQSKNLRWWEPWRNWWRSARRVLGGLPRPSPFVNAVPAETSEEQVRNPGSPQRDAR